MTTLKPITQINIDGDLLIKKEDSPTLHNIYKDEYGICILASNEIYKIANNINHKFTSIAKTISKIEPHITILQGKFNDIELKIIKNKLINYSKLLTPFTITMAPEISLGGDSSTSWDVKKASNSWEVLQNINIFLSDHVDGIQHPVGLIKRVERVSRINLDDSKSLKKYGRYGNIPGNNTPHITLVYEMQDESFNEEISLWLANLGDLSFIAIELALVQIDDVGNIYKILDRFPFSDSKLIVKA